MTKTCLERNGHRLWLYSRGTPQILFLQPVDAQEARQMDRQLAAMADCALPFALAAFEVKGWERELSPWEAPPVFGNAPFGDGAEGTLDALISLLPELKTQLDLDEDAPLCLGGYSLAGLFALWASTRSPLFAGIAAASPSVWFPGWLDWQREHPIRASAVYLSLGDREERTKNPIMASVGNCIREQQAMLADRCRVTLEWNPGGHFRDPERRTARAFCWIAGQMAPGREKGELE